MNHRLSTLIGLTALSLSGVSYAEDKTQPANPSHGQSAMSSHDTAQSKGSQDLHKAMMEGMQEMRSMKMSGDMDLDFTSMMIHHHEQAIAMSKAQLKSGKDADVKRKANEIIAASEKDIAELNKWKSQHSPASR